MFKVLLLERNMMTYVSDDTKDNFIPEDKRRDHKNEKRDEDDEIDQFSQFYIFFQFYKKLKCVSCNMLVHVSKDC